MEHLFQLRKRQSRSICPENPTGAKGGGARATIEEGTAGGPARNYGIGWKVNPFIHLKAGETVEIANIEGSGVITNIWMTPTGNWRTQIIRFYWDDSEVPSVECPVGDFFCSGWSCYSQVSSLAVCVNPGSAFNCYWQMPFRRRCRITMENISPADTRLYYQISYDLCELPEEIAYFHAFFNRSNPLPHMEDYVILDKVEGRGQYVGTYMTRGVNTTGWWGEGEIKFFMDGDEEFPTICGTGTEDYFTGSYNFEDPYTHDHYVTFTTPYSGLNQVIEPDRLYRSQMRFGMYRWHITDSIAFDQDIRVTMQSLGWNKNMPKGQPHYLHLQDDISSVAYFYLDHPLQKIPALPPKEMLEIN